MNKTTSSIIESKNTCLIYRDQVGGISEHCCSIALLSIVAEIAYYSITRIVRTV